MQFFDNGVLVATVTTNGAGKADNWLSRDAALGTHSITAVYTAPNGAVVTSDPVVISVVK